MQKSRLISEYQYQCRMSHCGNIWWSLRSDITRCPNCTRHGSAIPIIEGHEPVRVLNAEGHSAHSQARKDIHSAFRRRQRNQNIK
jgi:hypothetical protein